MPKAKMTELEMIGAAALAAGVRLVNGTTRIDGISGFATWRPHEESRDSFELAASLRISVEHNDPYDRHPWVCASVWTDGDSSKQQYLEDVPDESQRADRMRLAILRCAAAQAPKEAA